MNQLRRKEKVRDGKKGRGCFIVALGMTPGMMLAQSTERHPGCKARGSVASGKMPGSCGEWDSSLRRAARLLGCGTESWCEARTSTSVILCCLSRCISRKLGQSGIAGTQTSTHTGCWCLRQKLTLLHHSLSSLSKFFSQLSQESLPPCSSLMPVRHTNPSVLNFVLMQTFILLTQN